MFTKKINVIDTHCSEARRGTFRPCLPQNIENVPCMTFFASYSIAWQKAAVGVPGYDVMFQESLADFSQNGRTNIESHI